MRAREAGDNVSQEELRVGVGYGEVNVGLEGPFIGRLGLMPTFSNIYRIWLFTATRYPAYYTDFMPYENFEKDSYTGFELV